MANTTPGVARDMTATWEGNRRRWNAVKTQKAIDQLVALGWRQSVTVDGLTLTEPPSRATVKADTDV